MEIEYSRAKLEIVLPEGAVKEDDTLAAATLKAGNWITLPAGTWLRIVRFGPTPAEIQKADLEREQADIAARKAAKVKP